LARAVVTLETERIKGSNTWCLRWWWWWWWWWLLYQWLNSWMASWKTDWYGRVAMIDFMWLIAGRSVRVFERLPEWLIERLCVGSDELNYWLFVWLNDYVTKWMSDGLSDWPPKWVSPWKKESACTTIARRSRWPRGLRRRSTALECRDRGFESRWEYGLRINVVCVSLWRNAEFLCTWPLVVFVFTAIVRSC
jgi:hypothetical protein